MVSDLMKVSFYRLATLSVPALDSRPFLEAVGSARILSKQVPPPWHDIVRGIRLAESSQRPIHSNNTNIITCYTILV